MIWRKKAAETGSLLTHFICLVLGLLIIKQMEKNCMIHAWSDAEYLNDTLLLEFLFSPRGVRC